jgi:hypothetical protein
MANHRNRFPARRRFLKQSTALTATMVALPHLARATEDGAQPADPHGAQDGAPGEAATNASVNADTGAPQDPLRRQSPRRSREPGR